MTPREIFLGLNSTEQKIVRSAAKDPYKMRGLSILSLYFPECSYIEIRDFAKELDEGGGGLGQR